jgi:phage-related protein
MTGSLTESLLPVLQKLVVGLTKVFDWFGSLNSEQQKTILIIAGVVAAIGPMLSLFLKMVQVAEAIKKVTLAMQTLGLVTKAQAVITKGLSIAQGALNLVMSLNPIALVIIAITALIAIFIVLWNKCEGFRNFWIGLWEGIKNIFFAVVNWIKTKINETINSFNYLKDKIKGFINSIIGFFTTLPSKLFNIGKDMLMGLVNGIKNVKSMAINSVKNLGKNILSGIRGVLGIHSPSKEFALIGKYSVVGYTEALDDMKSNVQNTIDDVFGIDPTMYNNASTHLSPNINMTVVNNMDFDPIGQVVNRVKTYSGGSKNDYNYGQGVS